MAGSFSLLDEFGTSGIDLHYENENAKPRAQ
jgi:hypothetical protein